MVTWEPWHIKSLHGFYTMRSSGGDILRWTSSQSICDLSSTLRHTKSGNSKILLSLSDDDASVLIVGGCFHDVLLRLERLKMEFVIRNYSWRRFPAGACNNTAVAVAHAIFAQESFLKFIVGANSHRPGWWVCLILVWLKWQKSGPSPLPVSGLVIVGA